MGNDQREQENQRDDEDSSHRPSEDDQMDEAIPISTLPQVSEEELSAPVDKEGRLETEVGEVVKAPQESEGVGEKEDPATLKSMSVTELPMVSQTLVV